MKLQPNLAYLKLNPKAIKYQLTVPELIEEAITNREGTLTENGALAVDTGKFTGRSPKDRCIVDDDITREVIWWGDVNIKFDSSNFEKLYDKVMGYLASKLVYVRDGYACANKSHSITLRIITEHAFQNLFANHLFLRYNDFDELIAQPEWTIIAVPSFEADPLVDGTRQSNFSIINFSKKIILIGGTAYTGEIKKGIFSVLNFLLPIEKNTLPMHCSANVGKNGDTAIFFGLSGTGKTTLSADPNRALIGDDEHGWDKETVFNFEGGCYAKCVDLSEEKEPEIFKAVKFGALLENTNFFKQTRVVNFADTSKTENTRIAYPINYIDHIAIPSLGTPPKNIFFLTADAFGVLPPISKLSIAQAMFHFISGYTAKVAGTETGVTAPQATFSACFGKAFLPLHPTVYAKLLGEKLRNDKVNVWLVNTGWSGGGYDVGKRMKLSYTRAMINAVLNGSLENESFKTDPVFGLNVPLTCADVPAQILQPKNTWQDPLAYDQAAALLSEAFLENFKQYKGFVGAELLEVLPKVAQTIN